MLQIEWVHVGYFIKTEQDTKMWSWYKTEILSSAGLLLDLHNILQNCDKNILSFDFEAVLSSEKWATFA